MLFLPAALPENHQGEDDEARNIRPDTRHDHQDAAHKLQDALHRAAVVHQIANHGGAYAHHAQDSGNCRKNQGESRSINHQYLR